MLGRKNQGFDGNLEEPNIWLFEQVDKIQLAPIIIISYFGNDMSEKGFGR